MQHDDRIMGYLRIPGQTFRLFLIGNIGAAGLPHYQTQCRRRISICFIPVFVSYSLICQNAFAQELADFFSRCGIRADKSSQNGNHCVECSQVNSVALSGSGTSAGFMMFTPTLAPPHLALRFLHLRIRLSGLARNGNWSMKLRLASQCLRCRGRPLGIVTFFAGMNYRKWG